MNTPSPKKSKKLTRRALMRGGIFACGGVLLGERWAFAVEPNWLKVEPVELTMPRLEKPFDGYRIAQISDIHFGDGIERGQLDHIVATTNSLQADLIAITGDFVTANPEKHEAALGAGLARLHARDGVVAVLGNHDHWSNAGVVRRTLREAGVRELRNQVQVLRRGTAHTFIVGADDPWCGHADVKPIVKWLPHRGAAILLAHEPDYADEFSQYGRFDLQLSGHSHAGQVCLPFIGPLRLPPSGRKYPRGLYRVRDMQLYTNRGVGTTGLPVRFNCRPEISIFTLRAA